MPELDFDIADYAAPALSNFDPLPKGDYNAMITSSDVKETKAGNGRYAELVIEITDGDFARRKIWDRLNIDNPDGETEKRARGQLRSVSDACGISQLKSTEQLHDIPFKLSLDIDRRDPTRNKVRGYSSVKQAFEINKPAVAVTSGKKPWKSK